MAAACAALGFSAQGAELPAGKVAAPARYVEVCDVDGMAGFAILGEDVCLRPYGDAKFETILATLQTSHVISAFGVDYGPGDLRTGDAVNGQSIGADMGDSFELGGRVDFGVTAASNTSLGPLVADLQFQSSARSNSVVGDFGAGAVLDHAWISFAGLTLGVHPSLYSLGNGGGNLDYASPDPASAPLIAYTAELRGGFAATASLEDSIGRRANGAFSAAIAPGLASPTSVVNGYRAARWPDIVARLALTRDWGGVKLAFGAHDTDIAANNNQNLDAGAANSAIGRNFWGIGVNAALRLKLPWLPGGALGVQGAWSRGAIKLSGIDQGAWAITDTLANGTTFPLADSYYNANPATGGGNFLTPTAWTLGANLALQATPRLRLTPQVSYGAIRYGDAFAISGALTGWTAGIIANWDPGKDLDFQFDLVYAATHQATPANWNAYGTSPPFAANANALTGRVAAARYF